MRSSARAPARWSTSSPSQAASSSTAISSSICATVSSTPRTTSTPAGAQDTLHRHQFGGTIGGPVKIPHISSGKTTQFFYGYQYTLIHSGRAARARSRRPPPPKKDTTGTGYADYSNLCTSGFNGSGICNTASQQISNPYTGVAWANNHIPTAAFDQAAVNFEKLFPTASSDAAAGKIGNTVNYFSATQNYFNEHTARVDHPFGASDHLFGRLLLRLVPPAGHLQPDRPL